MSPDTRLPLKELRALLVSAQECCEPEIGNGENCCGLWIDLAHALAEHAPALLSGYERAEKAEAECLEQARVNGMGMEREAALIARAEKAEAALAEQTARAERWRDLASIAYHNMERGADVIILETGATWNDTFVDALGAEPPPPQEGAERE